MNAADRKAASALKVRLEELKSEVETVGEALRELADAEQEKFDNMPESLQQGDAGQAIETAAGALDEAASAAEEGNADEAIQALDQVDGL